LLAFAALLAGCKPDVEPTPTPSRHIRKTVLHFPAELRADDPSVNAFIESAIETCAAGDYEKFRLLWVAKEQPITQQEFQRGWKATESVTILDVQKGRTLDDPLAYAVRGLVQLDPNEVPEPKRDLVLLIVKENDSWHLKKPPPGVVRNLKGGKAKSDASSNGAADSNGADPTTNG
jgi:hypothetical protein